MGRRPPSSTTPCKRREGDDSNGDGGGEAGLHAGGRVLPQPTSRGAASLVAGAASSLPRVNSSLAADRRVVEGGSASTSAAGPTSPRRTSSLSTGCCSGHGSAAWAWAWAWACSGWASQWRTTTTSPRGAMLRVARPISPPRSTTTAATRNVDNSL